MAETIDIFNPTVSVVSKDFEGKILLIHSSERKLGKTLQATRFPKPYYLRFEQGINAIPGLAYAPLTKWVDFKRVRKQLTDPKTLQQAREKYTTLIVDSTDVAIKWCEAYVCGMQGVERLRDGNNGYGLYKELEQEWFREWSPLVAAGYSIIFIAHSEPRKMKDPKTGNEYEQMYPKGDKRTIDFVIDAADYIGYVKSNGYTEEGEPQLSSIFFQSCPEFLSGSRFKYMAPEITPFTAENVQKAMREAIEQEEKESGHKAVSQAEKVKRDSVQDMSYAEAIKAVKPLFKKMVDKDKVKTTEIIAKYLGEGVKLSETTEKQIEQILMIISDFNDELNK